MAENENEETKVIENNAPAGEDLEAIKAQLEDIKGQTLILEQTIEDKDERIAGLEKDFSEAVTLGAGKTKELEASVVELASVTEARDQAVAKYLGVAKALNPSVPETILAGATIAEIDASIDKGKTIVESVKKAMEAEATKAKVPAGAPTRSAISTEGLSAREKIAAGIQPKGGS